MAEEDRRNGGDGRALVELETDKVTLEVNASAAGVLTQIVADEGANVEVGGLLGTIDAAVHSRLRRRPSLQLRSSLAAGGCAGSGRGKRSRPLRPGRQEAGR
ncbi:MAG: biotin/lipoyl-containing protein [Aliidongia sp.]